MKVTLKSYLENRNGEKKRVINKISNKAAMASPISAALSLFQRILSYNFRLKHDTNKFLYLSKKRRDTTTCSTDVPLISR